MGGNFHLEVASVHEVATCGATAIEKTKNDSGPNQLALDISRSHVIHVVFVSITDICVERVSQLINLKQRCG